VGAALDQEGVDHQTNRVSRLVVLGFGAYLALVLEAFGYADLVVVEFEVELIEVVVIEVEVIEVEHKKHQRQPNKLPLRRVPTTLERVGMLKNVNLGKLKFASSPNNPTTISKLPSKDLML